QIRACESNVSKRIVVKPADASGSTGVRPLSLSDDPASCLAVAEEVLHIVQSLPVREETAHCETAELLIEPYLEGEEFSVESRQVQGQVETLAIHWKVDIDHDSRRFFERIFVTLPESVPAHGLLAQANRRLLQRMAVSDGVFHAEYR